MIQILIDASIRCLLIAAAIAVILRLTKTEDAAARHRAWAAGMLAMLVSPAWLLWGPHLSVEVLPQPAWQTQQLTRFAPEAAAFHAALPGASPSTSFEWRSIALFVYLPGLGVMLIRMLLGVIAVVTLLRTATPDGEILSHPACVSPMTVGWIKPRIVLPSGWRQWRIDRLNAVLVHEREHVRRLDPAIQWLALVNRAVFWFHPLAWWMERRLTATAEEACDASVIAQGVRPAEYADSLLSVAEGMTLAGSRIRLVGMNAAGSSLAERLEKILAGPRPRLSPARLKGIVGSCAVVAALFGSAWLTSAQPTSPAFEAASIKVNSSGEKGGTSGFNGSFYRGENVTLKRVISLAYQPIQEFAGGPDWINTQHYDITARAAGTPDRPQFQLMLRSLLADRFQLVVHKETRSVSGYALKVRDGSGRTGHGLRPSTACASPESAEGCGGFRSGNGLLTARGVTLAAIAAELYELGRPVKDETGLTGKFDIDLHWTPDEFATELTSAIRTQLGLELESTKVPVEFIVIDKASMPAGN